MPYRAKLSFSDGYKIPSGARYPFFCPGAQGHAGSCMGVSTMGIAFARIASSSTRRNGFFSNAQMRKAKEMKGMINGAD